MDSIEREKRIKETSEGRKKGTKYSNGMSMTRAYVAAYDEGKDNSRYCTHVPGERDLCSE